MALKYGNIEGQKRSMALMHWLKSHLDPKGDEDLKWILDPPFQRGSVWTKEQKIAWIETILDDLPVPAIFINQFGYNSFGPNAYAGPPGYERREIVIDGRQRIEAILDFLQSKIRVRGELWCEQTEIFRRKVLMGFTCSVITTTFSTMRECAELYLKLLKCGTAHTAEEIKKAEDFVLVESMGEGIP